MEAANLDELKRFVQLCKEDPSVLHTPPLDFFKNFLQSLGARIPASVKSEIDDDYLHSKPCVFQDDKLDVDMVESDIEFDESEMGNPQIEVTEENQDAAQVEKSKAMRAISEGKLNEAIDHLTEAIMVNPKSAMLYATRASVFVKLKKPNAAIRDADAALQINPDSAKGYKSRGMAKAMLGLWEDAAGDLHVASKIDYDEEINMILKKVKPNVDKIEEHRRKYERRKKEKELTNADLERQQRQAEIQAEAASVLKDGQVVIIVSLSELDKKLSAASTTSRLAVLYFTATWCGPCRYISPEYSNLAGKYPKVVFLKVDIDEAQSVAARWNVSGVPTFFFIKNGKEVDKIVGADKNLLERKIAQLSG